MIDATHSDFVVCHRLTGMGLSVARLRALLDHIGDNPLAMALELSPQTLTTLSFTEKQQQRYKEAVESRYGAKLQEAAQALQMYVLRHTDAAFPALLREVEGSPLFLFVRGTMTEQDNDAIAIVGSRRTTTYGRDQAALFARAFADQGVTVISGGAQGIDTAAHKAVLETESARTIAVLGCGLDTAYPPDNKGLFQQIADGRGAVISEYPLGTPPDPWRFPARNRIIAAMSRATVVIETPEGSGALITAQNAVEYNRDVWVVPGPVDTGRSRGGHRLVQDGAALADSPNDVLRALGKPVGDEPQILLPLRPEVTGVKAPRPRRAVLTPTNSVSLPPSDVPVFAPPPANLSPDEAALLAVLEAAPRHLDEASALAGLSAPQTSVAATLLTVKGLVKQLPGNLYVRA